MGKPRSEKTEKIERELLRRTLEKILLHRAGVYLPLRHLDLVTPAMEHAFDEALLHVLALLGVSLELHDPVRGVVESFNHRTRKKRTRFMSSTEWNKCHRTKYKNLRFIDEMPDPATLPIPPARPRRSTTRRIPTAPDERDSHIPCTYR
jgi:hypothetical protein